MIIRSKECHLFFSRYLSEQLYSETQGTTESGNYIETFKLVFNPFRICGTKLFPYLVRPILLISVTLILSLSLLKSVKGLFVFAYIFLPVAKHLLSLRFRFGSLLLSVATSLVSSVPVFLV